MPTPRLYADKGLNPGLTVYLHGISYALGRRELISTIEPLAANQTLLEQMNALGLVYYRHATETPVELAAHAAAGTLKDASLDASGIDLMLYASSSLGPGSHTTDDGIRRFTERLGLTSTTPIGVSLAECANFGAALQIARSAVAAGDARTALVVTTDVCTQPGQRILLNPPSVLGDGAASCLITSVAESRIEVLCAAQGTNQLIRSATTAAAAMIVRKKLAELAGNVLARAGVERGDVRQVIASNVNEQAARFMADSVGVDHKLCYLENIQDVGHVHSADNLINLLTYMEDGIAPGSIVMTISSGSDTWGVALLRIQ